MCGIYGMVAESGSPLRYPDIVDVMGETLRHRGPDGRAVLAHPNAVIGTERLRIIDIHERADQPFAAPGAQVWLECNGEIYNAPEIRARYPDYPFRSHSDVESILPLYLERGIKAVEQLDGMFALAIWDNRSQTLLLARDRAGEKPLFYARVHGEVVFASELQCLLRHPDLSREIDHYAIADYLSLGYITEPRTPFRAVSRIPAGTYAIFRGDREEIVRYWDPASFTIEPISARDAVRQTRRLVDEALEQQVMGDVPGGAFISGAMDCSRLAAVAE